MIGIIISVIIIIILVALLLETNEYEETITSLDENPGVPTSFFYDEHYLQIAFYTKGKTSKPTINWNGGPGIFTLDKNYKGLTIDNNTGVIYWDKRLALTTFLGFNIRITATNSKSTNLLYLSIFEKEFKGKCSINANNYQDITITLGLRSIGRMCIVSEEKVINIDCYWHVNANNNFICSFYIEDVEYRLDLNLIYSDVTRPYFEGFMIINNSTNTHYVRLDYQILESKEICFNLVKEMTEN